MLKRAFASDWLKLRHTWIVALVFFGPMGVIGLQAFNWGLRYDYLTDRYAGYLWETLIKDVHFLSIPALLLGITLVASMLAGMEHQHGSWKQTLALPIRRRTVYISKWLVCQTLMLLACILLMSGTVLLGYLLGFGGNIPWDSLLARSYYPWLTAGPILALQLWLSVSTANQTIPLSIGIVLSIMSLSAANMPDWMPLKWPLLMKDSISAELSIVLGVGTGLLVLICSIIHFTRKDVS
ncbi:ABC transporter permease [Paenibacillus sp. SC116]|uniref:ABC transporter permease n=1 Tax=Paenibacillus sp. SC116 TaxID=2968986 RepID=UPI00215A6E92|nr:ABC transporter permease [Paenibacillus sp. SC116]MCR8846285.1 ABC transporter permease [Paenibacillus sp. SC116]